MGDSGTGCVLEPFPVTSLAGNVVLWLDANQCVTAPTGTLTEWADQSGHNNNATPQAGGVAPSLVAGDFNGLPAVQFGGDAGVGSTLHVVDSPSLRLGTGDFLIEAVVKWTNVGSNYGIIYGKPAQTGPYSGAVILANYPISPFTIFAGQTSINDYATSNGTSTTGLNDGVIRYVGFQRTGTTLTARVDGMVVGTAAPSPADDCSATGVDAFIGGQGPGIQNLVGEIGEIIVISGTVASADVTKVENYFGVKYRLF
jgi:hypothetical protein